MISGNRDQPCTHAGLLGIIGAGPLPDLHENIQHNFLGNLEVTDDRQSDTEYQTAIAVIQLIQCIRFGPCDKPDQGSIIWF
jgi:hypothetical protein